MAAYLLEQGFSVFIISWKNIDSKDYSDYGLIEYTNKGVIEAMNQIKAMLGVENVHLTGYCMGALLCTVAAAYLRGQGDETIKTLSYFAAQIDFSDSGELKSFIDESQIAFLEDLMVDNGYLDKSNMGTTMSLLKPRDLYWNYLIDTYFLAKEPFNFDFLYWNDDGTRMPRELHIDILKRLYLNDELTEGKFRIKGRSLDLRDVDMDLFFSRNRKRPYRSVEICIQNTPLCFFTDQIRSCFKRAYSRGNKPSRRQQRKILYRRHTWQRTRTLACNSKNRRRQLVA
jgi:polyhydroxyalkanoate synthase